MLCVIGALGCKPGSTLNEKRTFLTAMAPVAAISITCTTGKALERNISPTEVMFYSLRSVGPNVAGQLALPKPGRFSANPSAECQAQLAQQHNLLKHAKL